MSDVSAVIQIIIIMESHSVITHVGTEHRSHIGVTALSSHGKHGISACHGKKSEDKLKFTSGSSGSCLLIIIGKINTLCAESVKSGSKLGIDYATRKSFRTYKYQILSFEKTGIFILGRRCQGCNIGIEILELTTLGGKCRKIYIIRINTVNRLFRGRFFITAHIRSRNINYRFRHCKLTCLSIIHNHKLAFGCRHCSDMTCIQDQSIYQSV